MNRVAKTFNVLGLRKIPDPIQQNRYTYEAWCNVHILPSDLWTKVNPRSFKNTKVAKTVRDSLETNPSIFHILNKGLVIHAADVIPKKNRRRPGENQQSYELSLIFSDEENHGVCDGGHTYHIIKHDRGLIAGTDAYVKLCIHTDLDDVSDFVEAQNTFVQVTVDTMLNHKGKFETLKRALEGTPLEGNVAYEQNGEEPVGVSNVISLLSMFIPHENPQTKAYNNAGACVKMFENEQTQIEYERLYPIAPDIIDLANNIEKNYKDAGLSVNTHILKMSDVKGKNKKGNTVNYKMYYDPNNTIEYKLPRGYIVPIIGAFYQLLDQDVREFKVNPSVVWRAIGGQLVSRMMGFRSTLKANSAGIGKNPLVWDTMNDVVATWAAQNRI